MIRLTLRWLLVLIMILTIGCSSGNESLTDSSVASGTVIVDRLDRHVRFAAPPRRIVSLSPATTELLFAIGAGPAIVGATRHCNYPLEAAAIPRVGGGTLEGISREAIIALQPDLVLCKWDSHAPLIETLESFGIPVIAVGPGSLQELFDEAILLGRLTGHQADADQLVAELTERLATLTSQVQAVPARRRRRVFYEVWNEPLMTAGPQSFIGELLEVGGMENIFADATTRYPRVSGEVVIDRDPEVILAPSTHASQVTLEELASRPGWDQIQAVHQRQVFLIDGDQVSRCGPRLLDALEQMIRAVYPEQVADKSSQVKPRTR